MPGVYRLRQVASSVKGKISDGFAVSRLSASTYDRGAPRVLLYITTLIGRYCRKLLTRRDLQRVPVDAADELYRRLDAFRNCAGVETRVLILEVFVGLILSLDDRRRLHR